jgi:hypothetical protein
LQHLYAKVFKKLLESEFLLKRRAFALTTRVGALKLSRVSERRGNPSPLWFRLEQTDETGNDTGRSLLGEQSKASIAKVVTNLASRRRQEK